MIRPSVRFASTAVLVAMSLFLMKASAQTQVPAAPAQTPVAPAPAAAPVFPKPDPQYFTASLPTKETINAFLDASWGYEEDRIWQVQAILKTPVDGISKVIVFVGDKSGKEKPSALEFFALPDGKHIITGDQIVAFGEHPFADYRTQMQQKANGPYRGAAAKDLELVEFADFQCPHCKEAQANMDKLLVDFPKARIVFENDPIASIHPQAAIAASYGACVSKLGGSTAFFQFASVVFEGQDGLATADGATLTLNSAVTKAGLDPVKVTACAATPETKADVDASTKLASDIGIGQVPTLVVNGREVPANAPYETLKKIITYQAKLDGITL
ncbi:MAG TPA: thioredoxin domain-containing protein [Terracidiphilus sp.]|nr:thioredoxin domain-containing protein [Terracidiphilus sp.]